MANLFPDDLIEEIRVSNDIVGIISEYVKLEKKGKNFFGKCPFHNEKTASFSVEPVKQIFHCFGCGKGGNVIHFIMSIENLEFPDALRFLADRAKILIPDMIEGNRNDEKAGLKRELLQINLEAARFFRDNLNNDKNKLPNSYLINRKIQKNTVAKFGLGYAEDRFDTLYKHLKAKGFSDTSIKNSGLVIYKEESGNIYDRFRGRIMFPIFDIRGNVIAFGGRVLDSSQPKYMNSPETEVYHKGKHLYALNFAKNTCSRRLILAEGYMDVISLHQSGILNSVAPLGTALTENQGRLLKKYTEEIVLSFDSDSAGRAAAFRSLDLLNEIGCNVKVLTIPSGKDPDEFIKAYGVAEFKRLVDRSESLLDFKLGSLKNDIDTSTNEGKVRFLDKAVLILDKIDNNVEKELYVKKLSEELGVSTQSIFSEMAKQQRNSVIKVRQAASNKNFSRNQIRKSTVVKNQEERLVRLQLMLLATICLDNSVYFSIKGSFDWDKFDSDEIKKAFKFAVERIESKAGILTGEILNKLSPGMAESFANIVQSQSIFEDNKKAALDIIRNIDLFGLEERKNEIIELKKRSDLTEGDVELLNRELSGIVSNIAIMKKGL
ncbi:DNA primase [Ruminiclostridium cellulolyticum]|uniref:DNA primase n=1 Tax=Ruminiclostridium cellulolyticum (strain ATCC 35319 / DSM 5812 / JCM 6584 / H10) TaxID=394503 RepID=B8I6N0_RUMCH|nr:DNA primase [Ruminiclostridium cellulolyticum]ACL74922.1 DNA primase [Ruminiclostridium cellulolyticum H10]